MIDKNTIQIDYATLSRTGERPINEDTWQVLDLTEQNRFMCMICDGMGGHAHGDMASQTVCQTMTSYWKIHLNFPDCPEKIIDACKKTSLAIDQAADKLDKVSIGSTLVMISIENELATIAHLGDSRCYLIRPGSGIIYQTQDHIQWHNKRKILTRCFFSYHKEVANPEIVQYKIQTGDRLLVCSDGLHQCIYPSSFLKHLTAPKPLHDILHIFDEICALANHDNYTAILLEIK